MEEEEEKEEMKKKKKGEKWKYGRNNRRKETGKKTKIK